MIFYRFDQYIKQYLKSRLIVIKKKNIKKNNYFHVCINEFRKFHTYIIDIIYFLNSLVTNRVDIKIMYYIRIYYVFIVPLFL